MGILSKIASSLIGGGTVTAVQGIANVIDQFVSTPDEKRVWAELQLRIAQQPQLAQIELNKVEASHRTLFVAGWRPAIGWVGAIGLAFAFLINPILQWLTGDPGPQLPMDNIMELILGMLGLGALRTFEKYTGKAR